jgi:putative ABC transport system substrate-binding protein
MRRRAFIALFGGAAAAWPIAARAEQPSRIWRVGYLSGTFPETSLHLLKAFERGLEGLGYGRGKNIAIEARWALGKPERLRDLAAELVRLEVDVIVTATNFPTAAAARATTTTPIVFVAVGEPVEAGFVVSLARPGKNLTGLSFDAAAETAVKPLEYLREIVPHVSRIACLRFRGPRAASLLFDELERATRNWGLALDYFEIATVEDIDRALGVMAGQRPEALLVPAGSLTFARRKEIAAFAATHRVPAAYAIREMVEAGGLISFGTDLKDMFRRAAGHVDKILKGANPAEIPVELPAKFELVINLKAAKALGLTVPSALLVRADEVIE